ncbi:MAG: hypothetical protein CVV30_10260 [Methanomicrobiales archaeon HGW-Methanomicrobiales-1]|nr:MAG: hypothetical protein CVV30_10260 [Methanomicrobiales archaeon HGW-Methanomicrobiales-1]
MGWCLEPEHDRPVRKYPEIPECSRSITAGTGTLLAGTPEMMTSGTEGKLNKINSGHTLHGCVD